MTYLVFGLLLFLGIHSIAIVAPGLARPNRRAHGRRPLEGAVFPHLHRRIRVADLGIWPRPPAAGGVVLAAGLDALSGRFADAARVPGRIRAALKHPMLAAVMLWALAHLVANGTLADALLFGGFLVWAVADRMSFKRRPVRAIRTAPPSSLNDVIAVAAGLALYIVFVLWLHARWIGVSPLPT